MHAVRHALFAFACFVCVALVAQETRLSNLAVRAQAGPGNDVLITGFTIGPGLRKTVLIRAVGPTLGAFGVPGTLGDPKLELYSGDLKIAENDNWTTSDAATFASVGAFAFTPGSRDAALVATLDPGSYTAQATGLPAGSAAGVALVEVYEVTGGATRLLNLSTRARVGTGASLLIPGITVSPGSGTRRLLLRAVGPTLATFNVPGALADPKLELFSAGGKIAENDNWGTPTGAGVATAAQLSAAFTEAGAFPLPAASADAALLVSLAPGSYTLQVSGGGGTTGVALVEAYDLSPPVPTLFVARLRPEPAAAGSLGSGYATVLMSPDGASASVTVSFSNLTSTQTAARLRVGSGPDYVLNIPLGQVSGTTWLFAPTGRFTTADLLEALRTGNLSIEIDSTRYPAGELRGAFVASFGSQTFSPPSAPPVLAANALTSPSQADAARFLTQATFGPTFAEINALTVQGIDAWITAQMALPPSLHLAATRADAAAFPNVRPEANPDSYARVDLHNRQAAWWKLVLTAPDQLRQRVAFALSEIFVVSEREDMLRREQEALARYYDLLVTNSFGNFRQLLDDVTFSPVMGTYLSFRDNKRADPIRGTTPDENYAREIMQLFTIGLVQLHPDGSLLLDGDGLPIPTYDQVAVTEMAKVFTGLAPGGPFSSTLNGAGDDHGYLVPMRPVETWHETSAKRIVSLEQVPPALARPTLIPANQTTVQDVKLAHDALFHHPNTGPSICRQLIQRLVTSNPSSGYVYRVAQKFADNGAGVRGDLGAVVRAILTDHEARSPAVLNHIGFGKVKEPLLRVTAVFRAFDARAPNGRFLDTYRGESVYASGPAEASGALAVPEGELLQAALRAPSVFNFFAPDFVVPGPLATAGLVSPELQIVNATTSITIPNMLQRYITNMRHPPSPNALPVPTPSPYLVLDFSSLAPLAATPGALVDRLNLLFCGGAMGASTRAEIMRTLPSNASGSSADELARNATVLVTVSPDAAVQR
jgi:uncharacterized protein (DUF1800 family)